MLTLLNVKRKNGGTVSGYVFVSSVHRVQIHVEEYRMDPNDRGRMYRSDTEFPTTFDSFNHALESFFFAYGQEGVMLAGVDKMFGKDVYEKIEEHVEFVREMVE